MRAIVFSGVGGNEVVGLENRPDPGPGAEELVVRVSFAGLNPADIQQREGRYPAPPGSPADVPGLEVSGVVDRCGVRVTSWQEGDRVFGLVGGGGLADRVVVHERSVTRIPDDLKDHEAAAVPEAFITAHDATITQAGLRLGDNLLVHGAAGGVGTAAMQIGTVGGARVFGVGRSDAALEAIRALGGEPIPDNGFCGRVVELTGGRGVDVILELVGALHFPENLEALATGGRIIAVGVGAGHEASISLLRLMQKRATVRGTVMRARSLEEKDAAVRAFEREVVPGLASGSMRAIIDSIYRAVEFAAAFDRLADRGKVGKVLIEFD